MKTKVNLCFYGQPRFSNNQEVVRQYKDIIDNPNYDVKTYGHVWYDTDAVFASSSWTVHRPDSLANETTVSNLCNNYKFESLLVEKPKTFRFVDEQIREHYSKIQSNFNMTDTRENNVLSQLYSIEKVMNLVDDDADFYVLCRYDTILTNFPDVSILDKEKLHLSDCGTFPDILIVMSKKFLPWLRDIYVRSQMIQRDIPLFIPECFKEDDYTRLGYDHGDILRNSMFGNIVASE